jgi:hypothetical protein
LDNTGGSGDPRLSQTILTPGKTYLVSFDYEVVSGSYRLEGFTAVRVFSGTGSFSEVLIASGTVLLFRNHVSTDVCFLDDSTTYELTAGPIDTYPWDEFGDYGEDPGMLNGERVYASVETHADGLGGTSKYHISYVTSWKLSKVAESNVVPRWNSQTSGTGGLVSDYDPIAVAPFAAGTATVSIAPAEGFFVQGHGGRIEDYFKQSG